MSGFGTNGKVELHISNGSTTTQHGTPRSVGITVRDHASGQTIVDIPLTADTLLGMLAGTVEGRLPAWIVPADKRDRIGKQLIVSSVMLPSEYRLPYSTASSVYDLEDLPDDVAKWVMNNSADHDEWRLGHHNTGWVLHFFDYRAPGEKTVMDVPAAALVPGDRILKWVEGDPSSDMTGVVTDAVTAPGRKNRMIEIEFEGGFSDQIASAARGRIERVVTAKEF